MDLKEAKVLITGATSGIGYETAKTLKQAGAQVVICARNESKLRHVENTLGVVGIKADVSQEDEVEALFQFALKEMGGLNVLVNNAGVGGTFSDLTEMSVDNFRHVWEINVKGLFMVGRAAARHFVQRQSGNIINIGSTAATKGFAKGSAYVASKFAVSGLTECWRAELRPYNVRVMQVNPSQVITNFLDKVGIKPEKTNNKLAPSEVAHLIKSMLTMNDIGFIPDAAIWATNPW